jgi:CRISPR-associated protein Cas5d
MLEGIYWKPEFRWVVESIAVLNPIQRASMVRKELKSRQSDRVALKWAKEGGRGGFYIESDHTLRHSLILKDVAYVVSGHIELKAHADKPVRAYEEQFLRRLQKGQCFQQPYFGCREYIAFFSPPDGTEQPIDLDLSLGYMLQDIDFVSHENGSISWTEHDGRANRVVEGKAVAQFFRAELKGGVLTC